MKAVIMAGGKGTRMDLDCEKPMVEVNNKPMINYVVDACFSRSKCSIIEIAVHFKLRAF